MSAEVTVLDGGLTIATDAMPDLETASVGIWVGAGARHETVEENGISHMLEHMAFKGTERRSARDIAEQIEAVGGHLNAHTSREHTAYYARVLKENLPLAVEILGDILQHSVFDEEELGREREVVVQEIHQVNDTPDDVVFDHLQEVAFPEQPLGRSILGTSERVSAFDRAALIRYQEHHYRPSNMVLAAAGQVDHGALAELAAGIFAELPDGGAPAQDQARYRGGDRRESRDLEQVQLTLGFPGVAYRDPDFYPAQVLATVLGGGMSSRLFQEVREKRGLAYSVFAFSSSYVDGGLFGIYAGTGSHQLAELVPVIGGQVEAVAAGADENEVARARAQLKASLMMSLESSSARCEQLARQLQIYGRPVPPAEVAAEIDRVDAGAVRAVARRIATSQGLSVAAIGPVAALESHSRIAARFA